MVLPVVRRGGVFKKARTDDPTPPTRRGEATNDQDDRRSRALGLMSVPNLKESVSSPVPQIYRCRLRDVCRPQVHYRHVQLRRIRKVPRVLFVSFMVRMLLRLGDGGITVMITPSPPAPSNVHSSIAARRSTRLLVVPTYRSDLV